MINRILYKAASFSQFVISFGILSLPALVRIKDIPSLHYKFLTPAPQIQFRCLQPDFTIPEILIVLIQEPTDAIL